MMRLIYSGMRTKVGMISLISVILLLVSIPASAYDYQGVPEQNTGVESLFSSGSGADSLDLSGILGSTDFASLISLFLAFIFSLLGIPLS